jgi:hypothetical protein
MFGISFFPIYGIVVGVHIKDSAMDGLDVEEGDYIMVQFLFFIFGISFIYVRDIN